MEQLTDLFPDVPCSTRIWVTDRVREEFDRNVGLVVRTKYERWAKAGLWNYLGKPFPLGAEWGGVFRLGDRGSLFRLLGFFEDGSVSDKNFVVPRTIKKRGQKLKKMDRAAVEAVIQFRDEGHYVLKES